MFEYRGSNAFWIGHIGACVYLFLEFRKAACMREIKRPSGLEVRKGAKVPARRVLVCHGPSTSLRGHELDSNRT